MSTAQEPTVAIVVTPVAVTEVLRFMEAEGVPVEKGGLRVSVQPGADDDFVVEGAGFRMFVDPFSAQYLSGVTIDYVSSMQGSGFTFKNPNSTGGCGCGSSFNA